MDLFDLVKKNQKTGANNNNSNDGNEEEENRAPYFVDLAANHPKELSNTFLLEKNGWDGLCIEPNHIYWFDLASHRTCTIIGAFIGGKQEEDGKEANVVFNVVFGGSIAGEGMDNPEGKGEVTRSLVSIATIFEETNVPNIIDYFSLDVEGAESLVMLNFPWDTYSFRFMTIERPKEDLQDLLISNGYKQIGELTTFGEALWMNESLVPLTQEKNDANIRSHLGGVLTIIWEKRFSS